MSKQLGAVLVGLALVGALILYFSKKTSSAADASPAQTSSEVSSAEPHATTTKSEPNAKNNSSPGSAQGDQLVTLSNGQTVLMSPTGVIRADTTYNNHPALTQDAMDYNILKQEGVNTPITHNVGGDPLLTKVTLVGGSSKIVARSATSDSELTASRKATVTQMANADPSYKNTDAYKKVMAL